MLTANGFAYDSSIAAAWGASTYSPSPAFRVWPFTMDYGLPIVSSLGMAGGWILERTAAGCWLWYTAANLKSPPACSARHAVWR